MPSQTSTRTRKTLLIALILLTVFLLGTVVVLSSISYYLSIPSYAYLTEFEVPFKSADIISALKGGLKESVDEDGVAWGPDGKGTGGYWMQEGWDGHVEDTHSWERLENVTTLPDERIPRLIHQTWKSDVLPEKWRNAWRECREGMPDYEYMLWTDELSRDFVAQYYPNELATYDGYKYPIQRADAIRYFILHRYGGIYMDLDIGCRRRIDPLLQGDWDVILPRTKPVGVSNDLLFAAKGSAFMDDTVHSLGTFDHEYVINYPTVMFSTGPMFVSAQYGLYSAAHPITTSHPRPEVRILPKSLYGKNAPIETVPHAFFSHFYGSSWHADDAGFITFLGDWGKKLMYVGAAVVVLGLVRLLWLKKTSGGTAGRGLLRVLIPGLENQGQGNYQLLNILPTNMGGQPQSASTPSQSPHSTPPHSRASSPPLEHSSPTSTDTALSAFKRAGSLILAAPATLLNHPPSSSSSSNSNRNRNTSGLLYFVPALFTPAPRPRRRGRTASSASNLPPERTASVSRRSKLASASASSSGGESAPPPYKRDPAMDEVDDFLRDQDLSSAPRPGPSSEHGVRGSETWDDWEGEADAENSSETDGGMTTTDAGDDLDEERKGT